MKLKTFLIQMGIAFVMGINWISSGDEFSFTLWGFGVMCGMAIFSLIEYLVTNELL